MKHRFSENTLVYMLIFMASMALIFWIFYNPVSDLSLSIPGMDNRPDSNAIENEPVNIGEKFEKFAEYTSELEGKWPRFRGVDYDNINKENIPLVSKWPNQGVKINWKVDLGEGHAAPAIYNGRVFILDYDEKTKSDALRCFSLESGTELWKRSYKVHVKRNHGMSRTIPAVNDKYIITIGPRGHVMCTNPVSGDLYWGLDIVKQYDVEIPFWYTGQCPLIDADTAIIATGGKALLVGIDCSSGNVIWETPNPEKWKMSHASIIPMTIYGKKMYVYVAVGGLCGISAEGADRGKLLWSSSEFSPSVVAPSALYLNNNRILVCAGYGAGSAVFLIKKTGTGFSVEMETKYKTQDGIASEQQTPLFFKGHVLAILPKDAGGGRNQLACAKAENCKNILWTSGKEARFGLGPYIIADGKIYILNDDGTMTIAKASTDNFQVLDKKRIIEGQDAWGPIAIADGRLLMRDSKQMVCIDIRAN